MGAHITAVVARLKLPVQTYSAVYRTQKATHIGHTRTWEATHIAHAH